MTDPDQGYVDTLTNQLCCRHASLLVTAENDLAVLRARIALTTAFIHDPAHAHDARTALAQALGLPAPTPETIT
ncbi:hypothetical protein [Streptomyces achromogenes]|uniref:hypothetical protein n=1 Tax=Streptomyces achromogenes TaxID=67255 RepID=UPI003A81101C